MRKFQCLLIVLKRSYIYCYIILITVPLRNLLYKENFKPDITSVVENLPDELYQLGR